MLAVQEGTRREFHRAEAGRRKAVARQEEEDEGSVHMRSARIGQGGAEKDEASVRMHSARIGQGEAAHIC